MDNKGWFMGPSSATVGETVSLSVSGLGNAVKAVFSATNASLSAASVSVSGGAASVSARMSAAGAAHFAARAYDENGTAVHEATHTIQVSGNQHFAAPAARQPVLSASPAIAGQPWALSLSGLAQAVSVVVDFYGANGGIMRIFPRGRDTMAIKLTPREPGQMAVVATARDDSFRTLGIATGVVDVQSSADMAGGLAHAQPLTARNVAAPSLGPQKPPYMLPHDTFAGEAQAGGTLGAVSASDIARDMQARTDALLNRLTKR